LRKRRRESAREACGNSRACIDAILDPIAELVKAPAREEKEKKGGRKEGRDESSPGKPRRGRRDRIVPRRFSHGALAAVPESPRE